MTAVDLHYCRIESHQDGVTWDVKVTHRPTGAVAHVLGAESYEAGRDQALEVIANVLAASEARP